jgi:hypothetical protein
MYNNNIEKFTNYNDINKKCEYFPYIDKFLLRCCDNKNNNCFFINERSKILNKGIN